MSDLEHDYHQQFARRIASASLSLFGDQAVSHRIRGLCTDYERQCDNILHSRGVPLLTIAVVGAKGQGKSWVARQFIREQAIRVLLPSGVLAKEATTKLYWVGPSSPENFESEQEIYIPCHRQQMIDLGQPYMLLDTPGVTDSDRHAVAATMRVLSLAPVKLAVVRRDQMRSAINSELASAIEGAVCIPVITAIPLRELPVDLADSSERPSGSLAASLNSDIRQLLDWLRASAPQTQFLAPILIEDFEASGEEIAAGERTIQAIAQRLQSQQLDGLAKTRANRLSSANQKFRRGVSRLIEEEAPNLSASIRKLHDEANSLPSQAIEAVLGSPLILQTAIRGRLRAQLVSDTSSLWFPYKTLLSLLSFTQGAWDRLILALTGSIPSLFGTLASWARNIQISNKVTQEMQDGIRERLLRQVSDRLEPIHHQFHQALQRLKLSDHTNVSEVPKVRLGGVDELQLQSRQIFESRLETNSLRSFPLQAAGFFGASVFWLMMIGPIVWIYRQYFVASWAAISVPSPEAAHFHQISPSMLLTSVLLSIIPVFLFAMMVMTLLLRRQRIEAIARMIQTDHHSLIDRLKKDGILRLHYEDHSLEQAEFLVHLDRLVSTADANDGR